MKYNETKSKKNFLCDICLEPFYSYSMSLNCKQKNPIFFSTKFTYRVPPRPKGAHHIPKNVFSDLEGNFVGQSLISVDEKLLM